MKKETMLGKKYMRMSRGWTNGRHAYRGKANSRGQRFASKLSVGGPQETRWCPECSDLLKKVPGGYSKRIGVEYNEFWKCWNCGHTER